MFKIKVYPLYSAIICLLLLLAGGLALYKTSGEIRLAEKQGSSVPCPALPSPSSSSLVFLESYFQDPGLYETALAAFTPPRKVKIRAGIVPHHFLAKDLMAEFFGGIDPQGVATVILAGPDHFKNPRHPPHYLSTTLLPWKTPFGMLEAQEEGIGELVQEAGAARHDELFFREHAIYTLIPFIKKALPQARVIPLILRDRGGYERFMDLGRRLGRQDRAILIASTDFSHGVSRDEAQRQDEESLRHLSDLKLPGLARIHSDCRPCLAAVMGFLGEGYQNFLNLNHKTSGDYAGAGSSPVTSYLTGYYTGEKVPEVRLLFTGDFMFDRHIRRVAANRGHDFILAPLKDLLLGYDLVVTNLEGPITPGPGHRPGAGAGGPYLFSFDTGVATLLRDHNLGLVHLGNNHSGDAGRRGLEQTLGYLRQARVAYFGDPEQDHQLLVREIAGIKMGFVSFNRFAPQGQERLWADLKMAREQCDLVVLYAHWGTEFAPRPGKNLRDLAHRFIDHGVDLIIGTHPHVIQEKEDYRGKMIYYSLGNFVFDQYFRQDTRRGLAVETRIHPVTLKLTCNDLYLSLERNGQTLLRKNEVPVEGTSQGEYIRPKNHAVR